MAIVRACLSLVVNWLTFLVIWFTLLAVWIKKAVRTQSAKASENLLLPINSSFYAIFCTDISTTEQSFTCLEMSIRFCCWKIFKEPSTRRTSGNRSIFLCVLFPTLTEIGCIPGVLFNFYQTLVLSLLSGFVVATMQRRTWRRFAGWNQMQYTKLRLIHEEWMKNYEHYKQPERSLRTRVEVGGRHPLSCACFEWLDRL